jgi:hypothetical protein
MMPKLIIVEGPDCSGKSTLTKFLAQQLNAIRWHMTWTPRLTEGMQDYQMNALENAEWIVKHTDQVLILDRHWPSERVYAPIFRPEVAHKFDHQALRDKIRGLGGIYVFCARPDVIDAHMRNQDPAHPYNVHDFKRVVRGYIELQNQMLEEDRSGKEVLIYRYDIFAHNMASFKMMIQNL